MLYWYYGIKGNLVKINDGKQMFYVLEDYLYNSKADIHEKSKCYPKLICMGLHLFADSLKEREQLNLCQNAIDMLRENKSFEDITELLRLYIPVLKKRQDRELGFYEKQYEVFCDLIQSEGFDIEFRPECQNRSIPKLYLVNEYYKAKRAEKGMTQDQISEEICTSETYSRIESGLRFPKPKNHKALTERLEIGWCYYRGELDTLELRAIELRTQQRIAEIEGRRYDALDLLDDLEALLDMDSVVNYQYISFCRCITLYRLGKIDIEETCEKLEMLFGLTQNIGYETEGVRYYSQTEIEIIAHWAQLLKIQGKHDNGIQLCEMILMKMNHSKVDIKQQWNGFSFLLSELSNLYFAKEEYETSLKIVEYTKRVNMVRRNGSNIPRNLDAIADNLEHIGEQYSDEYQKLYRYTYYIADFFGIDKAKGVIKKYYEENFDNNMIWY